MDPYYFAYSFAPTTPWLYLGARYQATPEFEVHKLDTGTGLLTWTAHLPHSLYSDTGSSIKL